MKCFVICITWFLIIDESLHVSTYFIKFVFELSVLEISYIFVNKLAVNLKRLPYAHLPNMTMNITKNDTKVIDTPQNSSTEPEFIIQQRENKCIFIITELKYRLCSNQQQM